MRGDVVEEALVVRNHERDAAVPGEELLEPADRENVEVVGGLVEEQRVGAADEHLRQEHAELEAARERRERQPVRRDRNAEPLEHRGGPRLERVPVEVRERHLDVGEPAGVAVGVVDDPRALLERLPHLGLPHHGEVEDDLVVVEEAVLPQDPDARVTPDGHRAVAGRLVPREDLEEGGLPRAVRADQAVAGARVELKRDPLEEGAAAVRLGELGNADHG